MEALIHNRFVINYARSSLSNVAGAAAGILGLQGWIEGFAFYLAASTLLSLVLYLRYPSTYFTSFSSVWTEEVLGGLSSFLLAWTLVNGLVYIY